jgi:hypothetical protein
LQFRPAKPCEALGVRPACWRCRSLYGRLKTGASWTHSIRFATFRNVATDLLPARLPCIQHIPRFISLPKNILGLGPISTAAVKLVWNHAFCAFSPPLFIRRLSFIPETRPPNFFTPTCRAGLPPAGFGSVPPAWRRQPPRPRLCPMPRPKALRPDTSRGRAAFPGRGPYAFGRRPCCGLTLPPTDRKSFRSENWSRITVRSSASKVAVDEFPESGFRPCADV